MPEHKGVWGCSLHLCETNLDDSIYSGNFSVRDYLLLIRKDSITNMLGLAVYVKVELHFALENTSNSWFMFSIGLTWLTALLLFPLLVTFFLLVYSF